MATGWLFLKRERPRLTSRLVASLPLTDRVQILYDPDLKGFGLRVSPPTQKNRSGIKSWIVEYRPGVGGRRESKRRVSLGRADVVSADVARKKAQEILAEVVATGADPAARKAKARRAESVGELFPRYLAATNPFRKPRTRELYEGLWRLHIGPALSSCKIDLVSKSSISELHQCLGQRHPATANRVVVLLSHFLEWCREFEHVEFEANPARGIRKFPTNSRQRYLTPNEFSRLGRALTKAETEGIVWQPDLGKKSKHAPKAENRRIKICPFAAAGIRLLLFTGARLREILHLEWSHIDLEHGILLLQDSKTGPKTIILPSPAIEILSSLKKKRSKSKGAKFVIEGTDPSKPRADLQRPWKMVRDEAGLVDFRLHDLRHSFASVGAASNLGLPVIGALLGHSDPNTTARYAHLAVEPLRAASDGISLKIEEMLNA